MYKYSRVYDEACSEAREVINKWMTEKLRDELQNDVIDSSSIKWHEDSDTFIDKFLSPKKLNQSVYNEQQVDLYASDEDESVNQWMKNVHTKLSSFHLSDFEAEERKNKPIVAKDPRLAMEIRQQKVREARARREEQMKIKLKKNREKKENEAIAREIVKKEALAKAQKEKVEEEAVQREMAKIRKQMFELKKKHQISLAISSQQVDKDAPKSIPTHIDISHKPNSPLINDELQVNSHVSNLTINNIELHEKVKKLELFQKQKLLRSCLHHWIRIVLSKRAGMGKAKALADWHLTLKTWSAWRKYYFEQVASKEAQAHENYLKQIKVHQHVAGITYRRRILKKCFTSWKKFVKAEQYSKELIREQEETKRKMNQLLGAVTTKAMSIKDDLVLEVVENISIEDDSINLNEITKKQVQKTIPKKILPAKRNTPKHAWQVRRSDVEKLSLKQIENLGDADLKDVTKIRQFKANSPRSTLYINRVEASKQVIAQQREMISQQKQIIENQQRILMEKQSLSDGESCSAVSTSLNPPKTTKVRTFQQPKRPKSLLAMEKRAEERLKRKRELEEKKKQAEKERVEKLIREEEEQRKIEEADKKRKQEEMRRLKQLEIEKENERKAFIAKMHELRVIAEKHYRLHLLQKYGLKPWITLIQLRNGKLEVARHHNESNLCRSVLMSWFSFQKKDAQIKRAAANQFLSKLLKRRCLRNWLKYGEAMTILEQKADIHRNNTLKASYLRKWERFITSERLAYFTKEEMAVEHNNKRLLRRVFRVLLVHKQNVKREELRNHRIAEMRKKVTQLLPDFAPESSLDGIFN